MRTISKIIFAGFILFSGAHSNCMWRSLFLAAKPVLKNPILYPLHGYFGGSVAGKVYSFYENITNEKAKARRSKKFAGIYEGLKDCSLIKAAKSTMLSDQEKKDKYLSKQINKERSHQWGICGAVLGGGAIAIAAVRGKRIGDFSGQVREIKDVVLGESKLVKRNLRRMTGKLGRMHKEIRVNGRKLDEIDSKLDRLAEEPPKGWRSWLFSRRNSHMKSCGLEIEYGDEDINQDILDEGEV